ncbi:hypothetical protein, variant [Capsaspora owczarzaki ATCC 30864]|nr:hypothetical protein, variant [Capsaspora owczarzaki ATCC 30864]
MEEGKVQLVQVRRSFFFKLVNTDHAITINFNTFFRMSQGVSETHFRLYITPLMTIADASALVFKRLKLKETDPTKFGIFGAEKADGIANRELEATENLLQLRDAWETTDPSFFQYQTKADLSSNLGADKEGWLEKEGFNVKSWKTRWFVLKGTSLFYYKDQKDSKPLGQIADIDKAEVRTIEHPFEDAKPGKKNIFATLKGSSSLRPKGSYFFEIVLPDRTWRLAANESQNILDWVEAIKDAAKRLVHRERSIQQETIKAKPLASAEGKLVDSAQTGRVELPVKAQPAPAAAPAPAATAAAAADDKRVSVAVFEMDDEPEVVLTPVAADSAFSDILAQGEPSWAAPAPVAAAAAAAAPAPVPAPQPTPVVAQDPVVEAPAEIEAPAVAAAAPVDQSALAAAQAAAAAPRPDSFRVSKVGASFDQLEGMLNDLTASLD